ncbi:P-loop containing nucleoside triphosphate hydrolase protein [Hygrophoropsis aurantiaca]|uniref:P-loop containing nucleoside triphosphate hydrolase protein n=1 Tax=Hygrophoropsis aurantiaca TaxID=72124 RepID=A0ACB7ZT64_9AGAM|nr:P-loop containing nucleoside triphosphate hydrolase protein [Hygrophoropsis aurantiaca]
MPPRGTKHKQKPKSQIKSTTQPPKRQHLTREQLEGLDIKIKEKFKWENGPYEFQMQAIAAQLQGQDVLVHTGTGAGKTAIAAGPHVHEWSKGKITIMVSPLIALHDEQVETFRNEFGLAAVAVNSSHGGCNIDVLEKIVSGEWQIVLISPEMLLSKHFIREVLNNTEFGKRVLSVVVDEAHVVSHWGAAFRKKYGTLGIIRSFLPRGTPLVAVSATLPARVRNDVLSKLQFSKNNYVSIDIGNDRPNVSIVVRGIQNTMNSFTDLDFVIPEGITDVTQIQKGFIYADNISLGTEISDHLNELLPLDLRNLGIIRPYNAAQSKEYRKAVMEQFRQGKVRILICTDAAGMGCNIPDIDFVIQWKIPASVSMFVQRAGRAARAKGRKGIAILLVEQTAFAVDILNQMSPDKSSRTTRKGKKGGEGKTYARMRGSRRGARGGKDDIVFLAEQPQIDSEATDEGLYVLIQTGTCHRKVLTQIYGNKTAVPTVPCCDICDPSLLDLTRPGLPPDNKRQSTIKRGEICKTVQLKLHGWRTEVRRRDLPKSLISPSAILPDSVLDLLSSVGPIESEGQLDQLVSGWVWYRRYGEELFKLMATLEIPPMKPLPKKPRGKKRTIADAEIETEDFGNGANISTQTAGEPLRKRQATNLEPMARATTNATKGTSAAFTLDINNVPTTVPSMFALRKPYHHGNVPPSAYNKLLWYPYTKAENPYLSAV